MNTYIAEGWYSGNCRYDDEDFSQYLFNRPEAEKKQVLAINAHSESEALGLALNEFPESKKDYWTIHLLDPEKFGVVFNED